ncbi:hypothetical protein [Paracidovorax anthurii]|uniref:Uncharacterized protein n=1 Tax=Paracidovorax anthurii TaxID=78229 RepID=A0A328YVX1_9BURK|nr:hypothetical protein [Paracidovorax anthurii]RAR77534.1 hypothetical protein AX018_103614 [Paracidovorax anthurii]WCM92826.1 hypothetical protein M5C99_21185 [Acidovorax sp. NCPPB 2350]
MEDNAGDVAQARRIMDFLRGIGLAVREAELPDGCFLPGVRVEHGGLCVDVARLRWPGDLLHEAGHLAVIPSALRPQVDGALQELPAVEHGGETEATAWAWAAMRHLGLDAAVLFHDGGYHGQAESLRFTFEMGVYLGSAGLVAAGLTLQPAQAEALGVEPYPHMRAWLRA